MSTIRVFALQRSEPCLAGLSSIFASKCPGLVSRPRIARAGLIEKAEHALLVHLLPNQRVQLFGGNSFKNLGFALRDLIVGQDFNDFHRRTGLHDWFHAFEPLVLRDSLGEELMRQRRILF